MTTTPTAFDRLLEVAGDLDITIVTGRIWPPWDGRLWIGNNSLSEILLPDGRTRHVALVFMPGGPGWDHIRVGRGVLDADGLARLGQAASAANGYLYLGRLAQLTPAEWLRLHGAAEAPGAAEGQRAHRAGAEIRGVDAEELLDAARAAGWPPHFGDEPVLFLDDRPIFNLLTQENVGRNATLVVGDVGERV